MEFLQPDFLRPIKDQNRDEHILVQFHRVFKNTNMSVLRNIFEEASKDRELLKMLPGVRAYLKLTTDQMYDATVMFNRPEDLVKELSQGKLSIELCRELAKSFMTPLHLDSLHITRLEFILFQLLEKDFVKNLYLVADSFTSEMTRYIAAAFSDKGVGSRIHLIEGNLLDSLVEIPEITTCFINNSAEFFKVTSYDDHLVDGKLILIADGFDDLTPASDGSKELTYAGLEEFAKYEKDRRATITYMYPHSIPKETIPKGGENTDA